MKTRSGRSLSHQSKSNVKRTDGNVDITTPTGRTSTKRSSSCMEETTNKHVKIAMVTPRTVPSSRTTTTFWESHDEDEKENQPKTNILKLDSVDLNLQDISTVTPSSTPDNLCGISSSDTTFSQSVQKGQEFISGITTPTSSSTFAHPESPLVSNACLLPSEKAKPSGEALHDNKE